MRALLPALFAAIALTACGPEYFEPRPATVVHAEKTVHAVTRTEPTVFLVLYDLHLPDADQCAAFRSGFLSALSDPLPSQPVTTMGMDVNQSCNALSQRTLDVSLVKEKLDWAAEGYPSFAARPIVIYINNLDIPSPPAIRNALAGILQLKVGAAQLHPRLWGVTLGAARVAEMEQWVEWTFADDEALAATVEGVVSTNLPQWSLVAEAPDEPLLTNDERNLAVGMKLCSADPEVETDLPRDGTAVPLDSLRGFAHLRVDPRVSELKGASAPLEGKVQLELCLDACDRHTELGDSLGPVWKDSKSCLETEGAHE